MSVIKFSHPYPKLWGQTTAKLLSVSVMPGIGADLREYDTRIQEGEYYKLPEGLLLHLVFVGNKGIPFTTLRSFNPEKFDFYVERVHQWFDVEVKGVS
jgi:hypothetical protein